MDILNLIFGILLLLAGRRLFWLFVGIVGFVAGFQLATRYLSGQPEWVILLIALLVGLIGAGLAIFLQRLAAGLAGFLAGGYIAMSVISLVGWQGADPSWLFYVLGGIVGAVLAFILFDWALIILSSLVGANLIVQSLQTTMQTTITNNALILLVLFAAGLIIQAGLFIRSRPAPVG